MDLASAEALNQKYQPRIEAWLEEVIQACRNRGLFCQGLDDWRHSPKPITERALGITVTAKDPAFHGIILRVRILAADGGMESFHLYAFWTDDLLRVGDADDDGWWRRVDVLLDVRPYKPEVWTAGAEARLEEVLLPRDQVAGAFAAKLVAETPKNQPTVGRILDNISEFVLLPVLVVVGMVFVWSFARRHWPALADSRLRAIIPERVDGFFSDLSVFSASGWPLWLDWVLLVLFGLLIGINSTRRATGGTFEQLKLALALASVLISGSLVLGVVAWIGVMFVGR